MPTGPSHSQVKATRQSGKDRARRDRNRGKVYDLDQSVRTLRWMLRSHELLNGHERGLIGRALAAVEKRAAAEKADRDRRVAPTEYGHHFGETLEQAEERRRRSLIRMGITP